MKNQKLIQKALFTIVLFVTTANPALSQDIEQIRWKNEEQVRAVLGEPINVTSPVGTHASYTLWQYENFSVAFANGKAFHLFDKNSLTKIELRENRPNIE